MRTLTVLLVVPCLFLSGCVTSPLDAYPKEQVAVIKSAWKLLGARASIEAIDGKSTRRAFRSGHRVLPGPHTVSARVVIGNVGWTSAIDLSLHAEAGHVYKVYAKTRSRDVWIWIIDDETKRVVGGNKPPE